MRKTHYFRAAGLLTAAALMLAQLTAMPVSADGSLTTKDIAGCNYVKEVNLELKLKYEDGEARPEYTRADFGMNSDEEIKEVWLDINADVSSDKPTMPVIGYDAPGCGDYNWYGGGVWIEHPSEHMTVIIEVPEKWPIPDKFGLQLWEDKGLESITVNKIGLVTGEALNIGSMTRKGDVNDDKKVDLDDCKALAAYLTMGGTLAVAANGDFDHNNRLTAVDLTMLKRGILNGDFNKTIENGETAMEFAKHLKLGWNLGNSLDAQSVGYDQNSADAWEQCWGNPLTTKELIDAVKAAGFNTVRVPVSWGGKMDKNTYKISDEWMSRVQKIVDYVIDNDMYCILNIHHDNGGTNNSGQFVEPSYPYFYPNSAHYEHSEKFVTSVWSQVSERFSGYDEHLIFETLNEPRLMGTTYEWWFASVDATVQDAFDCINKLNAAALKTIRDSGGNNAKRYVLMPTYAASPNALNVNGMVLPDDDHIMAEIHGYRPEDFAMNAKASWSEASGAGELKQLMNTLKAKFMDNDVPVVIDEFGAVNNNNEENRAEWAKYYVTLADSYGISCVWWDNNAFGVGKENFGLINRSNNAVQYPKIVEAMVEASKNRG